VTAYAVHWLDVFTDIPFAGNPLAVLPDADGLADDQLQAIARELGLSETAFVFGGAARLRIFTPTFEVPLAGHPVVGAAHLLARIGRIGEGTHVFETGVGETAVDVEGDLVTMTQAPLEAGEEVPAETVATMLRIDPADIVGRMPRFYTTSGIKQLFARVRDRELLAAIEPDVGCVAADERIDAIMPWCEHGDELAQRFFGPRMGIVEDPATGSAAGALAALRVFEGGEPGSVIVRQGEEIGRPSEMRVSVGGSPGAPDAPRVGGRAVQVLDGALRL
jgi:trans-2,3-dihydro-3-hydroxyanthranilate isomerase